MSALQLNSLFPSNESFFQLQSKLLIQEPWIPIYQTETQDKLSQIPTDEIQLQYYKSLQNPVDVSTEAFSDPIDERKNASNIITNSLAEEKEIIVKTEIPENSSYDLKFINLAENVELNTNDLNDEALSLYISQGYFANLFINSKNILKEFNGCIMAHKKLACYLKNQKLFIDFVVPKLHGLIDMIKENLENKVLINSKRLIKTKLAGKKASAFNYILLWHFYDSFYKLLIIIFESLEKDAIDMIITEKIIVLLILRITSDILYEEAK